MAPRTSPTTPALAGPRCPRPSLRCAALSLSLAMVLGGGALPTRAATEGGMVWADFGGAAAEAAAARVNVIAMADKPGDVRAEPMVITDRMARVNGRLSRSAGSQWSTLGLEVAASDTARPVDLSGYDSLRIHVSSNQARDVRIRLKGPDAATQSTGCYPVVFQRVGRAEQLEIPLSAFSPEGYCGTRGASIQQTLPAVVSVEVTYNEPAEAPLSLGVGRIEFVRAAPAEAAPARTAAAPSAGPYVVWAEDFNAAAGTHLDDTRWRVEPAAAAAATALDGKGHLAVPGRATLRLDDDLAWVYGRMELRLRVPKGAAMRASLRGAPLARLPWPEDGEFVLVEVDQGSAQVGANAPGLEAGHPPIPLAANPWQDGGFHTVALDWAPQLIRWQIDGETVHSAVPTDWPEPAQRAVDHWPFVLDIESAGGGDGPVLIDHMRLVQTADQQAAGRERLAKWQLARAALGDADATSPAAQAKPKPARRPPPPARPAEPSPPPRVVKCERNRLGLMMCY